MADPELTKPKLPRSAENMIRQVASREARMLRKREGKDRGIWFSLGMLGVVGWSIAVPMLIGIAAGVWIDRKWPSRFSWTLMLLFVGLGMGCVSAWMKIKHEQESH
jgi:ATP synthase protein I